MEMKFEQNFTNAYGRSALGYLTREYSICDEKGSNYFLDYFIRTENHKYAVEENGDLFWDDVVNQNLNKLRLTVEPVKEGQLVEIDTVEELKKINESR